MSCGVLGFESGDGLVISSKSNAMTGTCPEVTTKRGYVITHIYLIPNHPKKRKYFVLGLKNAQP